MCKLVAAGHGDALSHLLARRGVLFVVLLHISGLFARVHLAPAEVRDLWECALGASCATTPSSSSKRVDGVMRREGIYTGLRRRLQATSRCLLL